MTRSLAVAFSLTLLAGCAEQRETAPTAAGPDPVALAKDYRKLKDLTPEGHYVAPSFYMLCRAPVSEAERKQRQETYERLAKAEDGPHALATIHVFADPLAERALTSGAKTFPVGAVLVKRKERVESPIAGVTVVGGVTGMIKRAAGYDPAHGDWEYFIEEDDRALERGKLSTCIACHAKAKGPDHVFATWYRRLK